MGGAEESIAEKKAVSFLYIALGEAARKALLDRKPNMDIKTTTLKDLLKECNEAFQKKRNRLMDRHKFLNRKQKDDESLEQFWHALKGLAANCDFGSQTTGLVYVIFVSNMKNTTVQERLFTEPKDNPEDALKFAVAFEQGAYQKKTICVKSTNIKEEPVFAIEKHNECYKCGERPFVAGHQKICKAKNVQCRNCGRMGHYARMCRMKQTDVKQNKAPQQKRVNVVQSKSSWSSSEDESGEEVEILHIDEEKGHTNKPFVLKGKFNRKPFHALIDTGSPITIFTKAHVDKMFGKNYKLQILGEDEKYVDYSRNKIEFIGAIIGQVEAGCKKLDKVRALIAENGARTVIGRDWLRGLGVKLKTEGGKCEINCVDEPPNKLFTEFGELFNRHGRVEGHEINAQFKENFVPKQQKGRRIPLQLQNSVEKELQKLMKNGHIEKVSEIKDDVFIQPTVITVKRDKTVKIALDARAMNENIKKDKYQMPNLDDLLNTLAETITSEDGEKVWFTSVDLKYAFGQVKLNPELAKHCNFAIIGGKASGIYRFKTGFYGLTVMPTEFQRIMEDILINISNVFVFIDDILIVTKGTKEEHEEKVREVFRKLDSRKLQLKEEKCKIAKNEIDWLGFNISEKGIKPLNEKVQGITEKLKPKNLKELRSYLGAVNQLTKFIPGLAQITEPFRDLLKREETWQWKEKHDLAFNRVQNSVQQIIKLSHFNRSNKLRIICDASHECLGAILMLKNDKNEWELLSCASRYLSNYEIRYSTNELELLAIVWAVEHFRNYVYGVQFEVISDHKALETALKSNHGNKTYSSRLTRWIDRLLPFDMEVVHQPGRTMGLADYLSRHPSDYNENEWSKSAKKLWESWFVVNSVQELYKNGSRQLSTNQRLNKLCNQPISVQQRNNAEEKVESADRLECENKQLEMSRLQISRERNNTRNLIKALKTSKSELIVQVREEKLKTSPLQSIVSSIEESSSTPQVNPEPEVKFVKVKTFKEITDGLLMSNYQADLKLQNIRDAVLRRDINLLSKENKLYRHVFKDLRVDRELVYFENRLVIPSDLRQAVLNSIHSGHNGRDAMLGSVDEVWWPQINRQIVAVARTCTNCQKAGKNVKPLKSQREFGTIRKPKQVNEEIALDGSLFRSSRK